MSETTKTQIINAEERLRQAMLTSDLKALSDLLAPDVVITNHLGKVLKKQDDLAAHESGLIKIHTLNPTEQKIQVFAEVAIVSVRMQIVGSYNGSPANGYFRFTRVWTAADGTWRVVAAHIGLLDKA